MPSSQRPDQGSIELGSIGGANNAGQQLGHSSEPTTQQAVSQGSASISTPMPADHSGTGGGGNPSAPTPTSASPQAISVMNEDQIHALLSHACERMRALGRRSRKEYDDFFDEHTWKWKIATTFFAFWAIASSIWGISLGSTSNTISSQSRLSADWANYYAWAATVCPAEMARNMSTPACEAAQNSTLPPWPRPEMPGQRLKRTIAARIAESLIWDTNATSLLLAEVTKAGSFCQEDPMDYSQSATTQWPSCADPSILYDRHQKPDLNLTLVYPSAHPQVAKRSSRPTRALRLVSLPPEASGPVRTYDVFVIFMFGILLAAFIPTWGRIATAISIKLDKALDGVARHDDIYEYWYNFRERFPMTYLAVTQSFLWYGIALGDLRQGAKWLAIDRLLDDCIAFGDHVSSPECSALMQHMTSQQNLQETILTASVWRGYVTSRLELYLDMGVVFQAWCLILGLLLLTVVLAMAWRLVRFLWAASRRVARRREDFSKDTMSSRHTPSAADPNDPEKASLI